MSEQKGQRNFGLCSGIGVPPVSPIAPAFPSRAKAVRHACLCQSAASTLPGDRRNFPSPAILHRHELPASVPFVVNYHISLSIRTPARACARLRTPLQDPPPGKGGTTFNRQPPQCHAPRSLRSLRLSIRFTPVQESVAIPPACPPEATSKIKPNHTQSHLIIPKQTIFKKT